MKRYVLPLCIGVALVAGFVGCVLRGNTTTLTREGETEYTARKTLPQTTADGETERAEAKTAVYVTRAGKKYHRAECQFLRENSTAITLKEAKQRGYTPCNVCKP